MKMTGIVQPSPKKSNEPINPGDVIFYYHPVFFSGTKEAERTPAVMEVILKRILLFCG
jgi:hypothetical protein